MTRIFLEDENGYPVLVSNEELLLGVAQDNRPAPFPGVSTTRVVQSGNPFSDPRTGKFGFAPAQTTIKAGGALLRALGAAGRASVLQTAASVKANGIAAFQTKEGLKINFLKNGRQIDSIIIPKDQVGNIVELKIAGTSEEMRRRNDAIRDAAREFDGFAEGDAQDFLKGRTNRDLTPAEIEHFVHDVREHRIHDMIDILDQRLRKKGLGSKLRERRIVAVNAPKGFMRKSLNGLMDEEVQDIARRLQAKGWTDSDLAQELVKRFNPKRQPIIAGLLGIDL